MPEPVAYEYRWTNPADEKNHPPERTAWKPVELRHCKTIPDEAKMLAKWTYNDRPAYEVRHLYSESQLREALAKQEAVMRQALDALRMAASFHEGGTSKAISAIKALQEALK